MITISFTILTMILYVVYNWILTEKESKSIKISFEEVAKDKKITKKNNNLQISFERKIFSKSILIFSDENDNFPRQKVEFSLISKILLITLHLLVFCFLNSNQKLCTKQGIKSFLITYILTITLVFGWEYVYNKIKSRKYIIKKGDANEAS